MNPWAWWIDWTRRRAERKAYRDLMMYGNSWIQRKWWGYSHVRARDVLRRPR